ncbi:MAG: GDSL-type esterase/lipase family protein [Lentimicrobiaceae bacterium]|nr:GDSL-type esterase/lipase family protein [Lentimicrobiaceae bacterium]
MKKIIIIGDSVSLRLRPTRQHAEELTYTEILRQKFPGSQVINLGMGAFTMGHSSSYIDTLVRQFADYYIINYGIVDASTRSVPQWVFRFMNNDNPKSFVFTKGLRFVIQWMEKKFRRNMVFIRGCRSWTSVKSFRYIYQKHIQLLQKETSGTIICIGINKPSERIEHQLPGTTKQVIRFNSVIANLCKQMNCVFIDTYKIINIKNVPDGIHFDSEGHIKLAQNILEAITTHENTYS